MIMNLIKHNNWFSCALQLVYLYGRMTCKQSKEIELPHLEAGEEGTVMITFVAPLDVGEYYRSVQTTRYWMDCLVRA
jgi:hypothetical protein